MVARPDEGEICQQNRFSGISGTEHNGPYEKRPFNSSKRPSSKLKILTQKRFPKTELSLYSSYYAEACNELAVPISATIEPRQHSYLRRFCPLTVYQQYFSLILRSIKSNIYYTRLIRFWVS